MDHTHTLTEEQLFCLEGCRSYSQYHRMRSNFENDTCLFCNLDTEINIVLWEDHLVQAWPVPDAFMRKELAHHSIIIPKRHIRYLPELTEEEALSMYRARIFLAGFFGLTGGIVATRFGEMHLNAGSVPHLHENIMMPNGTGEVRVPVFKDPADRGVNQARAAAFALRYESGEKP